jgi:hypothetical protein
MKLSVQRRICDGGSKLFCSRSQLRMQFTQTAYANA